MKKLLLIILFTPLLLNAQHLIGTAGVTDGDVVWSVGDVITLTLQDNESAYVTQGFLQPEYNFPSGIFNVDKNDIKLYVYPNPVVDRLYISFDSYSCEWTLCDISGKTIAAGRLTDKKEYIDMSNFTPGYYILSFEMAEGKSAVKVIK